MKIKSFILAVVFAASSLVVFGQKGELTSAKSNYDKFLVLKGANSMLSLPNLKTARASIDKAVVHDKTINDPAT